MSNSLRELLATAGAFQGYAYAYPHKTAYRHLSPPRPLADVWAGENKENLFLYAHLPFCEMRCGFCNLFTMTHPQGSLLNDYLEALECQSSAVAAALRPPARFARLALGGGTPTFLSIAELNRLFAILNKYFAGLTDAIPKAVEASPATVDEMKMALLREQGVTRLSLGVQSFLEEEVRALGRAQKTDEVRRALSILTSAQFKCINVDLIYGILGQTVSSWKRSLEEALEFAPHELYLYPLYVRPLTGLDHRGGVPADNRLDLYRVARDFLLHRGYEQISMRLFRSQTYHAPEGPVYCCQEDGMVGLGAGARSYTSSLHYSTEYAVSRRGVLSIIKEFNQRTNDDFSHADYGCELAADEQRRRYILKSLLRVNGLDCAAYARVFSSRPIDDYPQLFELLENGWAFEQKDCLRLTDSGLELSDVIGPWLCSSGIRQKMRAYALT